MMATTIITDTCAREKFLKYKTHIGFDVADVADVAVDVRNMNETADRVELAFAECEST